MHLLITVTVIIGMIMLPHGGLCAFPWGHEIKITEFLLERYRLINHPAQLIIIAGFNRPGQREVFPERMPLKTIIGQQAAQIRVTGEENPEQSQTSRSDHTAHEKRCDTDGATSPSPMGATIRIRWLSVTLSSW